MRPKSPDPLQLLNILIKPIRSRVDGSIVEENASADHDSSVSLTLQDRWERGRIEKHEEAHGLEEAEPHGLFNPLTSGDLGRALLVARDEAFHGDLKNRNWEDLFSKLLQGVPLADLEQLHLHSQVLVGARNAWNRQSVRLKSIVTCFAAPATGSICFDFSPRIDRDGRLAKVMGPEQHERFLERLKKYLDEHHLGRAAIITCIEDAGTPGAHLHGLIRFDPQETQDPEQARHFMNQALTYAADLVNVASNPNLKQVRPQTSDNLTVQRWGRYIAKEGNVKFNHAATNLGRNFYSGVLVPLATAIAREVKRRKKKTGLRRYGVGYFRLGDAAARSSGALSASR